jgi:hypothetical protein
MRENTNKLEFVCLFVCSSYVKKFSAIRNVTIIGDRTSNLELCLAVLPLTGKILLRNTPTATRGFCFKVKLVCLFV